MNIVCQTKDPVYAHLTKVASCFPEAMKQAGAAQLTKDYYANLSDESFALPDTRQFPMNNREQTLLSLGYAKIASTEVPKEVIDVLEKAASIYDINIEELYPEAQHTLVHDTANYLLPDIQRFKVANSDDVKILERIYVEKYAHMSSDQRVEAGLNLIEAAKTNGVKLLPATHKLAGFTITSTQVLKDWTEARRVAAEKLGSNLSETYTKVASDLTQQPPYIYDRKDQLSLVDLLVTMDKTAGIDKLYGSLMKDPFRSVFNTDMVSDDFVKVGSALANKQLLAQLPLTFWKDVLGESGALEVAPDGVVDPELLAQVVDTLPADLKANVETQLAAYNK